jgi:Tfp pilus assembly protein PilZ
LEFLKTFHPRKTSRKVYYLPNDIRRIIISYLKEEQSFYVQDMGSVHGTYMKVQKDHSSLVKKGQNFQIGTDIYFNIVDLQYPLEIHRAREYP